jgi:ElaB/YqjD/DUF883 family membrane-anchored ribosome-binding protein
LIQRNDVPASGAASRLELQRAVRRLRHPDAITIDGGLAMADVTDLASPARKGPGGSTRSQEKLEEQVARLQDDIKAIAASLARLSDEKVGEARSTARAQYKSLVRSGQNVVDDLGEQVGAVENQMADAIRERPLTAVAGAIGVGFLIALLSRR